MNELIAEHTQMTKRVALSMARRCPHEMRDDLVSAGLVGLTEAAVRWDGAQPFVPFALIRIKGAVLDEMRRGDMMPRKMRRTASRVAKTIRALEAEGGTPTDETIAGKLGVSVAEYREKLAGLMHAGVDSVDSHGGPTLVDRSESMLEQLERKQQIARVRKALEALVPRDATILALHYVEEMTFREIGTTLEISPSRVCQLLQRAMIKLREALSC